MTTTDMETASSESDTPFGEHSHAVVMNKGTDRVTVEHDRKQMLDQRAEYAEGQMDGVVLQSRLVFQMLLARHELTEQNQLAFGRQKYDSIQNTDVPYFAPVEIDGDEVFTWSNRDLLVVCEQDAVRWNGDVVQDERVKVTESQFYLGNVGVAGRETVVLDFYTDLRRAAVAVGEEHRGERPTI